MGHSLFEVIYYTKPKRGQKVNSLKSHQCCRRFKFTKLTNIAFHTGQLSPVLFGSKVTTVIPPLKSKALWEALTQIPKTKPLLIINYFLKKKIRHRWEVDGTAPKPKGVNVHLPLKV